MALIWSRPNIASGSPVGEGDDHAEREDRSQPGPQSHGEHGQDTNETAVGRPHAAGRDQPPERVGVLVLLNGLHELRGQPARRAEEVAENQPPDGVRVNEHQAGQDPQQSKQGGIGRREPEIVPGMGERMPEVHHVVDSRARSIVA